MNKIALILILMATTLLTGCPQQYVATKSALELQAIQAKEFETTKKVGFASALSVLQDLGYIVEQADLETGLITAKSPTKSKFVPFIGNVMETVKTSVFVEEVIAGKTKIRANFVKAKRSSSGYGQEHETEVPIEEAQTYQDFFTKVQQGIFIRSNT